MTIVEQIQSAALDRSVPVSDLLRRVKLAAAKLKLTDTHEWVERELNGYLSCEDEDLPPYRVASGSLMSNSAFHGTRIAHGDPVSIAALSICYFREPVGALESLIVSDGDRVVMPLNVHLSKMLSSSGASGNFSVHFSKNVLVSISDSVRNLVLDWAIKLEEEGILGDGVSFSMEEKKKAADAGSSVYINLGHHHQGDTHGHQNRTVVGGVDASTNSLSIEVFEQLQQAVSTQIDNATDRGALLELIKQMDATKGTSGFRDTYTGFIAAAANHMSVIAPFLPALTQFLPG